MAEAPLLLIVERNRAMLAMLRRFFARQQIEVQTVTNAADAKACLAQRPVRVVFIDLFLPHDDGLTLVRHVRQVAPHTRLVVMGAFSDSDTQQDAIEAGAHVFLEKPFTLGHLWDVVQKALQDHES